MATQRSRATAHGLTARGQAPSLRLRRLATELRTLRQTARLTRDAVAQATELNSATLWRIETGRARPQRRTLLTLMDLYGVRDEHHRTELIGLAQPVALPGDPSPPADGRPLDGYATLVCFEAEACRIRLFESRFVPDLFQTESYARATLAGVHPDADPDEIDRMLRMRMRRQLPLAADRPVEVHVVVDEGALHRRIGGDRVHRDQLQELVGATRLPSVNLQVLPYSVGAHVGLHAGLHSGFALLDFPDPADAGLLCVETTDGPSFLEGSVELADHLVRFERLRASALDPDQSRSLLARLADQAEMAAG